ncbi:DNA recombination/repair protein RecA, partial [Kitasatospora herbaricolor]
QLGQGKENSRNFLIANPDIAQEIEDKIKIKLGIMADPNAPAVPVVQADDNVGSIEEKLKARKGA